MRQVRLRLPGGTVTDYFTSAANDDHTHQISYHFANCTSTVTHPMDDELRSYGHYWACEQPERPHGQHTCYMDGCHPCGLAATAAVALGAGQIPGVSSPDINNTYRGDDYYSHTTLEQWWLDEVVYGKTSDRP